MCELLIPGCPTSLKRITMLEDDTLELVQVNPGYGVTLKLVPSDTLIISISTGTAYVCDIRSIISKPLFAPVPSSSIPYSRLVLSVVGRIIAYVSISHASASQSCGIVALEFQPLQHTATSVRTSSSQVIDVQNVSRTRPSYL